MRTKYTVINLLVSVGGQLFSILLSFISRMFFIHYLSAEYLGLNGLSNVLISHAGSMSFMPLLR